MRKGITIVVALVASASLVGLGVGSLPQEDVGEDRQLIEAAVLNYINSYYQTRPELLEESVHPNLKKRNIRSVEGGGQYLNEMTRSQLIALAAVVNADGRWTDSSRKDVIVYDIDGEIASAKLIAENWVDYFHLARIDGQWMIVNVLWAGR